MTFEELMINNLPPELQEIFKEHYYRPASEVSSETMQVTCNMLVATLATLEWMKTDDAPPEIPQYMWDVSAFLVRAIDRIFSTMIARDTPDVCYCREHTLERYAEVLEKGTMLPTSLPMPKQMS